MTLTPQKPVVAYFSAEWGSSSQLPIYAGGLGVLAADILKQASNSNFPMVGIGLFYQEGFFKQKIDAAGTQIEEEFTIDPCKAGLKEVLDPETGKPLLIEVGFPVEPAAVKVWQKQIGKNTPLFLLDADIPVNKEFEQEYTAHLYEGEWSPFLEQEFLLGVGGVRLLRTLKIPVHKNHINDDHAAPSILERLREELIKIQDLNKAVARVKNKTIFTTHTPVASAVSEYPVDSIWPYLKILFQKPLTENLITKEQLLDLGRVESRATDQFSFSVLALKLSGKINAVSKRHQQVSKRIWHFVFAEQDEAEIPIDYVTNAVHSPTWIAPSMDEFFKKYLGTDYQKRIDDPQLWQKLNTSKRPHDREDNMKNLSSLDAALWQARLECKQKLLKVITNSSETGLERFSAQARGLSEPAQGRESRALDERSAPERFPKEEGEFRSAENENLKGQLPLFLGFSRRFAPYKRVYLLTSDLERLSKILTHPQKPVFLFVAGKAHPADAVGKKYLKDLITTAKDPRLKGHLIFVPDYNFELAKILTTGVDVWLNTPLPPMEASGTSGMKAALNGVLNASVADGWWWKVANALKAQGSRLKETSNTVGWTIGPSDPPLPEVFGRPDPENDQQTAAVLYDLLETQIVPLYYEQINGVPNKWIEKIKQSFTILIPQFNTQRLLKEYQEKLYV